MVISRPPEARAASASHNPEGGAEFEDRRRLEAPGEDIDELPSLRPDCAQPLILSSVAAARRQFARAVMLRLDHRVIDVEHVLDSAAHCLLHDRLHEIHAR
ncbi:hypothetical protein ACVIOG_003164 [Rhizobium leguminosarum]